MLLILTNSIDGTTDEIVRRIGSDRVFRFNVDLWMDYEFEITPNGFWISDPLGWIVRSDDIKATYVRKPTFDDPIVVPEGGSIEAWTRQQISYFVQELYNICSSLGTVRLVEKGAQQRFGKFSQMLLASRFFAVPDWRFAKSAAPLMLKKPSIAKALVADFVQDYRFLYTTPVDSESLDTSYPWFVQDLVNADADLTVVYVDGELFAFTVSRSSFPGVDWRRCINRQELDWRRYQPAPHLGSSIQAYMKEASLSFGRLDFLLSGDTAFFLEVNPNGQWGWLDVDGSEGLFDSVVRALTKGWSD
jgi:hypothetical protein